MNTTLVIIMEQITSDMKIYNKPKLQQGHYHHKTCHTDAASRSVEHLRHQEKSNSGIYTPKSKLVYVNQGQHSKLRDQFGVAF